MGISNWSVTYVDWSKRRRHPKTYRAHEISLEFMNSVSVCFDNAVSWKMVTCSILFYFCRFSLVQSEEMSVHVTSLGEVCSCDFLSVTLFIYTFTRGFEAWRAALALYMERDYTALLSVCKEISSWCSRHIGQPLPKLHKPSCLR